MTDTPDERLMTRYLLWELSPDEQEAIQERIAEDEEFFEAVCALEDELILQYHRGELSQNERERFEAAYSAPPRRARVQEARAFLQEIDRTAVAAVSTPTLWQRAREWLTRPIQVPGFAVVAATTVVAVAVWAGAREFEPQPSRVVNVFRLSSGTQTTVTRGVQGVDPDRSSASGGLTLPISSDATAVVLAVDLGGESVDGGDLLVECRLAGASSAPLDATWTLTNAIVTVTLRADQLMDGRLYTLVVSRRDATGPDLAAHAFGVRRK